MAAARLNVHREGSGTPVVLIHGIAGSWQHWKPIIPALASRHEVIALDLPGFGGSAGVPIVDPSLAGFARAVLETLDDLGIDRFHVVGNSLGGAVSVELLRSGRVLSFTGVSPAGQTTGNYLEVTKLLLRALYYGARFIRPVAPQLVRLRPVRAAFMLPILGHPWKVSSAHAAELVEACAIGSGFERTLANAIPKHEGIEVPSFDGPSQILWGTRDALLPVSGLARYAERWPSGKLEVVELPGLGHVPMQDDPPFVADTILDLVARADRAAAAA